jgi:hypothetical protein
MPNMGLARGTQLFFWFGSAMRTEIRAARPFVNGAKGWSTLFVLVSLTCQALTVDLIGALADFDDVAVGVADVAADLAVLRDRFGDELGASAFP